MTSIVAEIAKISRSPGPKKAAQLLDYAGTLQRSSPKTEPKPTVKAPRKRNDGNAVWERTIDDPRPRPKLEVGIRALEKAVAEGKDEPMDFDRL